MKKGIKILKKLAVMLCITSILLGMCYIPTQAFTTLMRESTKDFKKAWENEVNYYIFTNKSTIVVGTLVYGYNTKFINEDYCWAKSGECKYQAILSNGKGNFTTSVKKAGKGWAKLEKQHKGNDTVSYSIWLSTSYKNVYSTQKNSNHK